VNATERAKQNFEKMKSSDYSHRWIYRETLLVRDLPALITEAEHLHALVNELRSEIGTLKVNVSY
jgi:hypothetical protein